APDGHVTRLIDDQPRPNGVLLSPDEKTLYVLLSGRPGLMAYPVETTGKLGPGKSLGNVERPGDGLTVDTKGNLYLTQPSLNTVQVIAPDGQTLGLIPVPEAPSNCAFGGKDMKTLYITARTSLYAVKMDATGHWFGGPAPKVTGAALRVPAVAAAPAPKASPLVLRLGGPGVDFGKDVAVDSAGNVIVTGYFVGAVDFDPGPGAAMLTSSGVVDQFLAKYDANGRHLWSFALGGPGADMPHSVVADRAGNLYLAGYFSARVDFDPGPGSAVLTSKGERDAYLAKYDPNGKYLWAVSLGGPQTDEANCLAVDDAGNAYVTGNFEGSLDAATGVSLRGAGGLDAFVAKFDANGKFAWAFALGGPGDDKGHGLAVDSSGNCHVSGAFNSAVDFDPGPNRTALTSAGGSDIFLACYKPSGALAWAKRMGGSGDDFAGVGAISVDGRGILHLSGMFSQTAAFDDLRLTSAGLTDIFFGKFAPDGKCLWARGVGGPAQDTGHRILADRDGSVYLTGSFHRRADFDPGPGVQTLTAENPDGDIFVAKYDAAGKLLWAHGFGDVAPGATGARSSGPMTLANQPKYSIGAGLALDASDRPIVTGRFFGSVDFDPLGGQTITSAGESDVFLVRFNPDGRP
ncbi:MAG: hypothetical protein FJ272_10570, partial [Planctomycetes bacterium]|nr:hypothetical protein [Planctomycetota bacterium]